MASRKPAHVAAFITFAREGGLAELSDDELADLADAVRTARGTRAQHERVPVPPARALVIDALLVARVPITPRLVAAIVSARTGTGFSSKAIAAVRRDDQRTWHRENSAGRTPGPKVAPALDHEKCEPVRAMVTVSTWPLEQRFVTPHSARVDHAQLLLNLIDEAGRLESLDSEVSARVVQLVEQLSLGMAGAGMTVKGGSGARPGQLVAVSAAEIERFGPEAVRERHQASQRASLLPSDAMRVWGFTPGAPKVQTLFNRASAR